MAHITPARPKSPVNQNNFDPNKQLRFRGFHDLAFSICGCLNDYLEGNFPVSLFLQSLVTYDDFCENTSLIDSPNLVVRLGGKYMNWATAAPQVLSLVLFQRPLPKVSAVKLFFLSL